MCVVHRTSGRQGPDHPLPTPPGPTAPAGFGAPLGRRLLGAEAPRGALAALPAPSFGLTRPSNAA
ncbi:hypothetical protein Sdia_28420 [Streptomyces diastaticus subsp. diastaticus]|uniref:Uncharacterized protein n=1 Tax=Streptomyces diastaticus subsp. diastaticus TaxID=68040 RepID=A0ABQ1CNX3_STRDI|nr:hypothetical protein Sdia_28420 [Streptomyces diastaticus subsp. diastaticus]